MANVWMHFPFPIYSELITRTSDGAVNLNANSYANGTTRLYLNGGASYYVDFVIEVPDTTTEMSLWLEDGEDEVEVVGVVITGTPPPTTPILTPRPK